MSWMLKKFHNVETANLPYCSQLLMPMHSSDRALRGLGGYFSEDLEFGVYS